MDNIKLKQVGAILLMAGLVLLGFTLKAKSHLLSHRETVQGRVLDRYTAPTRSIAKPELILRVEFSTHGSTHRIERTVEEDFWNAHAKGSNIEVALPTTPSGQAKLVGSTHERLYVWLKIAGGGVAVLLGLVVLGYDRWRT